MRVKQSLLLFFIPYFVSGFLNLKNELKTNNEISQRSQNDSSEPFTSTTEINGVNATLAWDDLIDIWSTSSMMKLLKSVPRKSLNISTNCERDVTDYTMALSVGELWALKMMDATGKYTWGLLSGNVFWLGSTDQCHEMQNQFIKWQKNREIQRRKDVPPFLISMNSVTLNLNIRHNELNKTYEIVLGLCLPNSCVAKDVEKLLYFLQDQRKNETSAIIAVRDVKSLSKEYNFGEDPVFCMLWITLIVVVVLVILGTFYDIALRYQVLNTIKVARINENATTEMKILNEGENVDEKITITRLWAVKEHNSSLDVSNSNSVPNPLSEALLSFSLLVNLSKIFSLEVGADTLAPIHGLKFLSMIWVILGHTCLFVIIASDSTTFRSKAEEGFFFQTISNGTYAVDTFFLMSGCLVSFLYFRTITKEKLRKAKIVKGTFGEILQFLGMVWYRYFRLTAPYLLVIGLTDISMRWYYNHSLLDLYKYDRQNCRKFWWRNVLYINTYFALDERCMIWSWYLTIDTQFYIIGIIILIIAARFISIAAFLTIFLLIGSWIMTAIITLQIDHVPSIQDPFAHYESLYDKPWTRIGPYLLGMIAGWYLYKCNCKLKIQKVIALLSWIFSFVTMLSIVYGLYGNTFSPFMSVAYTALSHSAWAISIAWILIACVTGHGGMINKILSWKYLYPLSRLTYCAYLIHPTIIRAIVMEKDSSIHLSQGFVGIMFLGYVVASYAAALFISLLFEAPMVSLLRIFHPLRQWKLAKTLNWNRSPSNNL
ncbi:nose resistant to fluoxetine protein 6-like [Calliopsis andreniformis]|uniref:nose resistant to fluoxetine protein 6-like n=1 Tax=Calliopsis andreniformis TaxID=337506 RepID=UPI003FCCDB83